MERNLKNKLTKSTILTWTTPFFPILLSACSSSLTPSSLNSSIINAIATPTPTPTTTMDTFVISNVNVAQPTSSSSSSSSASGASTYNANIFFNTSQSTTAISNHCSASAGSGGSVTTAKACICQFKWNELNPNTNSAVPILRTVQTTVSTVQPSFLTCPAPAVYQTEIPDGTGIAITILPASNNPDFGKFTVNSFAYSKSSATTGSFQDSQGHVFDNVLRYACYQKYKKGLNVTSMTSSQKNADTGATSTLVLGTQFCVSNSSSSTTSTTCPNALSDYSAQSYYFNLYLRNSERGDFNISSDTFTCPTVKEALNTNGQMGTTGQPWPFDASFALSLAPTTSFTIGVEANTKLSGGKDPVASSNTCFPQSTSASPTPGGTSATSSGSSTTNSTGFIHSCLGFAARVNTDLTCPSITIAGGQTLPTYRLRRYVAIYPKLFDVTGAPLTTPQAVDTIYVLDRPLANSPDPTKPYTMLGPKPCPFAYYDRTGVTTTNTWRNDYFNGGRGYYGTNNSKWNNTNVDGIEFPNLDDTTKLGTGHTNSCSTSLPILSDDRQYMSFSTVNLYNSSPAFKHMYVRKALAFSPHYEEDTNFLACAPQAIPATDPPLHFALDSSAGTSSTYNVGWCAEAYPTQNGNIQALDPANTAVVTSVGGTGMVAPFTSHVQKNTTSAACIATTISGFTSTQYKYPGDASYPSGATLITTNPPVTGTSCGTATPNCTSSYGYAGHHGAPYPYDNSKNPYPTDDQTCDRTVISTDPYTRFPLLAPPQDVESAITLDSSYFCKVTYDGVGGAKSGKLTPTDGCCNKDRVKVVTGNNAATPTTGHLEPDMPCGLPRY